MNVIPRVPRAVRVILLILGMTLGYEIVRHPSESWGAEINNSVMETVDNSEANAGTPEIDLVLTSAPVVPRSNKLRIRFSIEAMQDLKSFHGLSAEVELVAFAGNEISKELNYKIVRHIEQVASAGAVTWDRTPPAGVQWILHKESFYDSLVQASNLIYTATQRFGATWVVAGTNVCTVAETLVKFKPAAQPSGVAGIRKVGTLGEFELFKDPTMNANRYLLGFKGSSWLETGYIFAPYLGLYTTGLVILDDMIARMGMAQRSALKVVNSRLYALGNMLQTGAAF